MSKKPIIIRNHADGSMDEVIASPCSFHIEQMDTGHWWIGVQKGTEFVHINLHSRGKIKATVFTEEHK